MFWKKDKHECDYKTIGVKWEARDHADGTKRDVSHIMFKCKCGGWYVHTIAGYWDIEEVRQLD